MRHLVHSSSATSRRERALKWLSDFDPAAPLLVVAPTLEAGARVLRDTARAREVTLFGWQRVTPSMLYRTLAEEMMDRTEKTVAGALSRHALVARVVQDAAGQDRLGRYEPVAGRPGLPRALAKTISELRMAGVEPHELPVWCADLAHIQRGYASALDAMNLADRPTLVAAATARISDAARHPWLGIPVLMLDVPVHTELEAEFWGKLTERADQSLLTIVEGDERTFARTQKRFKARSRKLKVRGPESLVRVQTHLFSDELLDEQPLGADVEFVSAPGESREAVEIARRIHRLADSGVRYDRIAVLTRSPSLYRPHLESAFRRAEIPAYFTGGTRAPDPAGRALLALMACAAEGLSARRFAEYASLGEIPQLTDDGAPPAADASKFVVSEDDLLAGGDSAAEEQPLTAAPFVSPRRWEKILLDAAVIGGRDRWARRLEAQREELLNRLRAARREDSGAVASLERRLAHLETMRRFVLPLIAELDQLPDTALWGEWLDALGALTTRAVRHPDRVLSLFAELQPMRTVGPVSLDEVRLVLTPRLSELAVLPTGRPDGRVWVSDISQARGMDFDVVFVPGLAERLFPQKVQEDPVLLDSNRKPIDAPLDRAPQRVADERLLLRLAVGAAKRGLVLSYPRLELDAGRPRVPSFYGLEILRAAEGRLPSFEELQRRAHDSGAPKVGWPAPRVPEQAIDAIEFDLSMLAEAFDAEDPVRGQARYLVECNPFLERSLRQRFMAEMRKWTPADGLVRPRAEAESALDAHTLEARSFSATALQHFSACPYRFYLYTVLKLVARDVPVAVEAIDPLQRGSLIHDVQYALLVRLREEEMLPLTTGSVPVALEHLDEILNATVAEYREKLAPAIEKVWDDGIALIRSDLREWVQRTAEDLNWYPWRFELAFGLTHREASDPEFSTDEPAKLDCGIQLRGAIDIVERRRELAVVGDTGPTIRATDTKTGKVAVKKGAVIDGGKALQPVLYSLALEALVPDAHVDAGRLSYSTARGGFEVRDIPLDDDARAAADHLARVIEQYVGNRFLPAAPRARACQWCDYRPVCGSRREELVKRYKKPQDLFELTALRDRR